MSRAWVMLGLALWVAGCHPSGPEVVVYTSQDQVYAEPVFQAFTRTTGIRVRALHDNESVKTSGLVNRLLAEAKHPRCDVFWNNEELRTRQLAQRGVVSRWISTGARSRRIIFNPELLAPGQAPASMLELTNAEWRGKIVMAYPLFGTTATHLLALRTAWGSGPWEEWCRALRANEPMLVDGNSVVVKLVARGERVIGLTDSDDLAAALRERLPVAAGPAFRESIPIFNTVGLVADSPHPAEAEALLNYLGSAEVTRALVAAGAMEAGPVATGLHVDLGAVADGLEAGLGRLQEIFHR